MDSFKHTFDLEDEGISLYIFMLSDPSEEELCFPEEGKKTNEPDDGQKKAISCW